MKRILATTGILACFTAAFLAAPAGAAEPPTDKGLPTTGAEGISARSKALMKAQQPLAAAGQRIQEAAKKLPSSGFTGISLGEGVVDVYWKGSVPASVSQVVKGEKVAVKVHAAKYSRAELKAAEATLLKHIGAGSGPMFGLRVPVEGTGIVALSTAPASTAQKRALAARPLPDLGIPVTLEKAEQPLATARQNDSPPYYGGGTILNPGGGTCSAGWAVLRQNVQYLLTASHCGNLGQTWRNGDGTRTIGTGDFENIGHDILLVRGSASGRIFDGGGTKAFETRGQFTKGVSGWANTFANEVVCQSGAVSGAVCDIRNSNNLSFSYCSGGECYSSLVLANRTGVSVRAGDSGGPVFTLDGTRVTAKGTISGQSYYPLTISVNGRCLDADATNLGVNGTKLQLWQCNGSTQQLFRFMGNGNLRSATSGGNFCVDADPATAGTNGGRLYLWTCNGTAQQSFNYGGNGPGDMRVALNGRCVDADLNQINTNGARIQMWDCNGSNQQRWNVSTSVFYQDFGTANADFGVTPLTQAS